MPIFVQGLMNLAEIQSFKAIGKRLRNARELRGLTLAALSASCGLGIPELVRIESGELLGFKQAPADTLSHAEIYAKVLDLELEGLHGFHSEELKTSSTEEDLYIPAFLRKR